MLDSLRRRQLDWLIGFLAASFGAAAAGGAFTSRSVGTWYRTLRKPRLNPPDWVFAPVWTALYLQMAFAAWLVRRTMAQQPEQQGAGWAAIAAWAVQLALNVSWSGVFFARRQIAGGLYVIAALWLAIAATAGLAARVTRLAAVLLLPYLAWVSFAGYLNYRLRALNASHPGA
jgi:tryptophan-rich sensory protein